MHFLSSTSALLALASGINAIQQGFNYGATNNDGSCRTYNDFKSQFQRASSLANAPGFTSARLYTSIQCGSANAPIEAIKAAIDTNTNLLLGLWASAGQDTINNEIAALKQAAKNWPTQLKARVVGISVGSEDLYRSSPQGVANNAGVGATSAQIVSYINQVRTALKGTALAGKKVGHVDTWTAWELGQNKGTINAVDFLGHNGFPYFETTQANPISNAQTRFNAGLSVTEGVAGGKPVVSRLMGGRQNSELNRINAAWSLLSSVHLRHPILVYTFADSSLLIKVGYGNGMALGPKSGQAVASVKNAKTYWDAVGCSLFGKRNVWWYTLYDGNTAQTDISFAVTKQPTGTQFSLQCPA